MYLLWTCLSQLVSSSNNSLIISGNISLLFSTPTYLVPITFLTLLPVLNKFCFLSSTQAYLHAGGQSISIIMQKMSSDQLSGVATIEATEAVTSVKNAQLNRLSRPEFWHPKFSTQTLLDTRQHYCTTHNSIYGCSTKQGQNP